MVSSEFRSVENEMNKGKFSRTARACYAGIVNQAIITNVTALLFVSFIELYNFSYIKLGMLTAVNFAAQMCADFLLIFLIDRVSFRKLAVFSCTLSFAGLLFYGCVPFLFSEKGLFTGIVCATTVFAFAGGMSEVVLSNIADNIPRLENSVSICLLKTVYAWAQVGLVAVCAVFLTVFGSESWNYLMFGFALIPLGAAVLVGGAAVVKKSGISKPKSSFHLFYILALVAIFLGYGVRRSPPINGYPFSRPPRSAWAGSGASSSAWGCSPSASAWAGSHMSRSPNERNIFLFPCSSLPRCPPARCSCSPP